MAILETFPSRDNSHTILDTDGTAVAKEDNLQFTGLDVTDDSTNEKTEVKAVGLNADSLDDICGGSVLPNIVQSAFNYSTNEQIVGKWIDGKPLYQKTAQITTPTSGANVSVYNTTGMNIDMVVNLDVFLNDAGYRNAKIYVNADVEVLKEKANSLDGYVRVFNKNISLAEEVLQDNPEIKQNI